METSPHNPLPALRAEHNKTNVSYFSYFIVSLFDVPEIIAPFVNMAQKDVAVYVISDGTLHIVAN
jgi:hypothetical protein